MSEDNKTSLDAGNNVGNTGTQGSTEILQDADIEAVTDRENSGGAEVDSADSRESRQTVAEGICDIFETVALSLAIVFVLFCFIFRICIVDGNSMNDTLQDSEKLLVSCLFVKPQRGDIVVFHETEYFKEPLVKRVIATEKEWIDIEKQSDGTLKVTVWDEKMENSTVLSEPYTVYKEGPGYSSYKDYPIQVPEGHIFVMGDNRNNSSDSRSSAVGMVDERRVLGKVLLRLLPLSDFGAVD